MADKSDDLHRLCSIYELDSKQCKHCHHECDQMCVGAGPGNCTRCKHVKDGPYCVALCPTSKFNDSGECMSCHENCVGGCTGPENNIGARGCRSCEKAIINGDVEVVRFYASAFEREERTNI